MDVWRGGAGWGGMMEGWMNGWVGARMDGWMDRWMDGRVNGWMGGC